MKKIFRSPIQTIIAKFPGYYRRNLYKTSYLAIILFQAAFFSNSFGQNNEKKPRNIILVIADDVGAEQVRSYANELQYSSEFHPADLPNIHLLEVAGIRFTQAWSNPSCSPTRAGIYTGQFCCTHGIYSPEDINPPKGSRKPPDLLEPYPDPPVYVPLPLSMAGSGYKKALLGKWHLGKGISSEFDLPIEDGFDHYAGSYGGQLESYFEWKKTTDGSGEVTRYNHATLDLAGDAKDWINARAVEKTPFFAVLAFNAPHWTMKSGSDKHEWNYLELSPHCTDTARFATATDTVIYKEQLRCLDNSLGELITFMKVNHPLVLDNTIFIFIGDNGTEETVGEGPVATDGKAKGTLYQAGVHVPFIIADGHLITKPEYRKISSATSIGVITKPGTTCDRLIHTRDIYGTVRELAGIADPDLGTESHSLVKFMTNPAAPGEQYFFTEGGSSCEFTIRNDHYKLIHFKSGTEEFYKIDKTKWDDSLSVIPIDKDGMTSDELIAYNKLKTKLESLASSCHCK